jgi:hypothetical protein
VPPANEPKHSEGDWFFAQCHEITVRLHLASDVLKSALSSCDQVCIKSSEYSTSGFAKKSTAYSPSNRLSMQQALLRRRLKCITNSSTHKECLLKRRRYKRQQTEGQAKQFTVRKARKLLKNAIATVSVFRVWYYFFREGLPELAPWKQPLPPMHVGAQ